MKWLADSLKTKWLADSLKNKRTGWLIGKQNYKAEFKNQNDDDALNKKDYERKRDFAITGIASQLLGYDDLVLQDVFLLNIISMCTQVAHKHFVLQIMTYYGTLICI